MKPNILFLLIDSFGSDKCFGNKKTSITPNLDSMIKNGVYFTQAISSAPVTCPSVSSIFTSRYPFECILQDENHFKLNLNIPTFLDVFFENGYNLHAIIPELISYMGLNKIFRGNVETYASSSTLYDDLGSRILNDLDSKKMEKPWFYYIHLLDLHGSATFQLSEGPKKFQNSEYGINQYEQMVSAMDVWLGKILEKIDLENTLVILTSDHGSEVGVYSKEIEELRKTTYEHQSGLVFKSTHKITTKFPKFLLPLRKKMSQTYTNKKKQKIQNKINDELERISKKQLNPYLKRILQNSIESNLGVFDDRFRIPLIFLGYGIPTHKIIHQQVRSIDIFPTITNVVNLQNKKIKNRGQSLIPLILDENFNELPVMVDSVPNSPKQLTSNVIGIRTTKYKYFRDRENLDKNVCLFDLINDPLEENNLAKTKPDVIIEMEEIFSNIQNDKNFNFKSEFTSTNDAENKIIEDELKKLGYL
jgi:arylsulfatase A-like enzyme